MKHELYCYATSLKEKGLQKIPTICFLILMSIFLVPIILSNVILGLILPCSFVLLYFLIKRESEQYNRDLLRIGLFLLFLGAEFSILTLTQHRCVISFIIAIVATLISYELLFFIKIKRKTYSNCNQNESSWINIIHLMFGGTGIWAGKLIAKSENLDLKMWIVILLCSLILLYSFTFFQKYFIHKTIR